MYSTPTPGCGPTVAPTQLPSHPRIFQEFAVKLGTCVGGPPSHRRMNPTPAPSAATHHPCIPLSPISKKSPSQRESCKQGFLWKNLGAGLFSFPLDRGKVVATGRSAARCNSLGQAGHRRCCASAFRAHCRWPDPYDERQIMGTSLVRLRQIEARIRSLSDMSDGSDGADEIDVLAVCGRLFLEAIEKHKAFSGHTDLLNKIEDAKQDATYDCPECVPQRVAVVLANHFAPALFVRTHGHRLACGPIADAIKAEIKRRETLRGAPPAVTMKQRKGNGGAGSGRPDQRKTESWRPYLLGANRRVLPNSLKS